MKKIPSNFQVNVSPGKQSGQQQLACNKVLPQNTWSQEIPTGYLSNGTWHSRFCHLTKPNYTECFQNKQILIFGDSNGRIHYFRVQEYSKCADIKKALTEKWHKPLLCAHRANNFSVAWNPHANPFLPGEGTVISIYDLVPTSKAIEEIPSHGNYIIILNHYFHLIVSHLSATEFMFRSIKDALVRLFRRNRNVQVLLQGPHITWYGCILHYTAGDMLGTAIMDLQHDIFREIKDKVVFYSPWDITIATENYPHHPTVNEQMFDVIFGFMCGR